MIPKIIEAMKQEIAKYQLSLLQSYPKDLEIDMVVLERFASPGMQYAWMVGDSHTHSAPLGVHKRLNELTTYVTRLANNDHFYLLSIGNSFGQFTLNELNRAEFAALVDTRIPYKMVGINDSFWLFRDETRVGSCIIRREGTYEEPVYTIELSPMAGVRKIDRAALQEWGQQSVVTSAGSLFVKMHIKWQDEIELRHPA